MWWILLFLEWLVDWARGTYWYLFGRRSGLCKGTISPPGPLVVDQNKKDRFFRKEFDEFEVPKNLDIIVIGSGIGGLTAVAVLAKLGKNVLVLEQDKQAGGLCKTFTEKGFEFDCGFHYIGQLHENGFLKVALDLITDGQVHFADQGSHVDTVVIGTGNQCKEYTIYNGKKQVEAPLKKQFPKDTKAVEEFFKIMKICSKKIHLLCMLKMVPLWFACLILWCGIADLISPIFRYSRTSKTDMVKSLTSNQDLLTVMPAPVPNLFCVPPKNSSCMMDALYPKGGASEILYHIIQVLEKLGGKVLVNAPVSSILVNVKQGAYGELLVLGKDVEILAPVTISDAGVFTTFKKLLLPEVQANLVQDYLHTLKPGKGFFQVFAGFNKYFDSDKDIAPDNIPMMYVSFPSAKDPTSCTPFPVNEPEMGEEYEKYKKRFANHLFDWACVHFPKLKQKVNFGYECCTTCQVILHYKFQMVWSEYKIPYMTMWCFTSGQDVFSGGCSGTLHGGLLCASDVMDHCLYIDLLLLQKKLKRMVVKKVE
uniref:Retinol saturase (all-trans-retinol 13,14-reductase) like n=1 Tax=Cyprinus carpio TaxID=7962 RepID=A0A8C2DAS3_CYPCA